MFTPTAMSRRDALRLVGAGLGSLLMEGCSRERPLRLSAVPTPTAQQSPVTPPPRPPAPTLAQGDVADVILVNGRIVTMDAANTVAQAVAIKAGRILRVGPDLSIRTLAGPKTEVIDLRGRTVTPGLVDAHNHLSVIGLVGTAYIDINPPAVRTVAELQAKIGEQAARTPKGEWIVAQGYVSFGGHLPDRHDLDPVSPNHPVMLINQGGHLGAVNSYALNLAGVNAATPNPRFGIYLRDESGAPTGGLVNHAAMDPFRRLWAAKVLTPAIFDAAAISPQAAFAAVGVTTFGDVNSRGMERTRAYFDAARGGKMTIRGYILNTIEYYEEMKGRVDAIRAMQYESDYLHFGGFKFLLDGAVLAAYTREPHNGVAWNIATWDAAQLKEAVTTLHAAGYQCSFHVIGDAAVDMALDAIEAAMNASPRSDPRHRLEHALLNTDDALRRTKELGVVVSTQPQAIRLLGDALREDWGEARARRMIPTRSWLDLGVPLSLSSDAPTLPWYQPQVTLTGSIARVTASNAVLGPEQALTIEEAMRAHTIVGAYAIFQENMVGSLESGKMADLAVWTDDPYGLPPRQLFTSTIDLTMVGGVVVHRRG